MNSQVGKPEILTKTLEGKLHEPLKSCWSSIAPSSSSGWVIEKIGTRKGKMSKMINHGIGLDPAGVDPSLPAASSASVRSS